jgi:hypothetical protein
MSRIGAYFRELSQQTAAGWNRFWFTPTDPAALALIRVCSGLMLCYTHAVWALDLEAFFGPRSWLDGGAVTSTHPGSFAWSHLWWCQTPAVLWTVHAAALVVFALFAVGCWSRTTAVLSYLLTVSYANRVPEALFGLDQINGFLAMYLMLGPSGAAYSVDRWRAQRRAGRPLPPAAPSISANIATRLMQLHLCVLYFFAGVSKLQGPAWWDGTAFWGAVANLEYQSIDMTWLVYWPILVNLLTHISVVWEISYSVLVWPRLTRPIVLFLALPLHLGIALCLGMTTFGSIMLVANVAFVSPQFIRSLLDRKQSAAAQAPPFERKVPAPKSLRRSHWAAKV